MIKLEDRIPGPERSGATDDWVLPTDDRERMLEFRGRFLGVASSRKRLHASGAHYGRDHAGTKDKCGACRWFEARIFRAADDQHQQIAGRWLVYRLGRSAVPGEVDLRSYEWLETAADVVEALTTRPADGDPFLSGPAYLVLQSAARHDPEIAHARSQLVDDGDEEAQEA